MKAAGVAGRRDLHTEWVLHVVQEAGYVVHGDLRHLVPAPVAGAAYPDDVSPADQLEARLAAQPSRAGRLIAQRTRLLAPWDDH